MPSKRQSQTTQRTPLPKFIQPQLATLVNSVPPGNEWLHEIKFDGYRILCRVEDGEARFLTREAQDWTRKTAQRIWFITFLICSTSTGATLLPSHFWPGKKS